MKTKDILLVDDDIENLHLLSMLLETEGFDVSTALGGINALETLKHNEFRMMITDFKMPEMDGVELANKVKERRSDMRIVLITGKSLSEVAPAAADAGISKIFCKPLEFRRFLTVIRSLLLAEQNMGALKRPFPEQNATKVLHGEKEQFS